jgi:DNA polymerase/3'-5' exonuclease PolX
MAQYYTWSKEKFRAKAYLTVSESLEAYDTPIVSIKQLQKAKLEGLGKSSLEKIKEYLDTGKIEKYEELKNIYKEKEDIYKLFTSIYGIGNAEANKFYNKNMRTLKDLWYSGLLNEAQKTGILWRKHLDYKISRAEMDYINNYLKQLLIGVKYELVGSYRRQMPSSGDVDILIEKQEHIDMNSILDMLKNVIVGTLAKGPEKFMGIMRIDETFIAHRIDIRLIEPSKWYYGLLYFTGSKNFNIYMRKKAIEQGMSLSEYGLYAGYELKILPADSEEDIFKHLHVPYMTPQDRV